MMFEISESHIQKLDDSELRSLVRLLCEAEALRNGLKISSVIAGGSQDAPDGGIDVRVSSVKSDSEFDFIPAPETGFQVKKPSMAASEITREMRPDGVLRPAIKELADRSGAYIIVSSGENLADASYRRRLKAMGAALADIPSRDNLKLDFYDRSRLAQWVNQYSGVALWVRDRVGEPLIGWQPYTNWAYGDAQNSTYLIDERTRLADCRNKDAEILSISQGVEAMRSALRDGNGVLRLVGLSGVGKTRLVQALFEENIGVDPLATSIVMYTDEGAEPTPSPRELICRLGAARRRTILVIDNCKPETHRTLTHAVRQLAPTVSLITIEYDVTEDEPEDTAVFRLEPASEKTIEDILERLAPHLGQIDRSRVAEFSGGNARIALALARNSNRQDNLARLTDNELFKRLFQQRNQAGDDLLRAAEICSLVYSFDIEGIGSDSELSVLASLASLDYLTLFRYVEEIKRRDLVQSRSRWRAVLPHAIANRLAKNALDRIPRNHLMAAMWQKGHERLLKSFSRRLRYLHDSETAKQIANQWLDDPSALGNITTLNDHGIAIFENVALLAPEASLSAIKKATTGENCDQILSTKATNRHHWMRVLGAAAYDEKLFDSAVYALAQFLAAEPPNYNYNSARSFFAELFHLKLSGTKALISQRLGLVTQLLSDSNPKIQETGLNALNELLESWHFSSMHLRGSDGRPTDFGWQPSSHSDVQNWYSLTLALCRNLIVGGSPHKERVKEIIATRFRTLWMNAGIDNELEDLFRTIAGDEGWSKGWLGVRAALTFDGKTMAPDDLARLQDLEEALRPKSYIAKVRAYTFATGSGNLLDFADIEVMESVTETTSIYERIFQIVELLGKNAPWENIASLDILIEELLTQKNGRQWSFGKGLALGAPEPESFWQELVDKSNGIPNEQRNVSLLCGYLNGLEKRSPAAIPRILDDAIDHPKLGHRFPELQCSVDIGEKGALRLLEAIRRSPAPIANYSCIRFGASDSVPAEIFRRLVIDISRESDGFLVAVDIVSMRIHHYSTAKKTLDFQTVMAGRELLSSFDFGDACANLDYSLNEIAQQCLVGDGAKPYALTVCRNLARALGNYRSGAWRFAELAETLFSLHPWIALHVFLGGKNKKRILPLQSSFDHTHSSPVGKVSKEILLEWARKRPKDRFPRLAQEIEFCSSSSTDTGWSEIALEILNAAPDRVAILNAFASRFHPSAWSGSLANVLAPYRKLASLFRDSEDPDVKKWAQSTIEYLDERIRQEAERDRRFDQSFE
ncbi:hypothetical protein KI614_14415 [Dechloromonas denitrificans]|uniref:ATP-binding protein n=1 Tax=Dechloromonas denitrificans TaxID=281362 RepID=UPI001CF7F133|nr:ATP-binding protein [Dechloromonas denitrificans]UCV11322.1 hypothetical protein KI614_14415 [Dechloromonas denitrificans]